MANAHDLLMAQRAAMMGGKSLPYDAEVEWVATGPNNVDFETGITPTPLFRIEFKFEMQTSGDWQFCCFQTNSTPTGLVCLARRTSNNLRGASFTNGFNQVIQGTPPYLYEGYLDYSTLYANGRSVNPFDGSQGTVAASSLRAGLRCKLYYLRIYEDGGLLRSYKPVRKNGVGMVYDEVTGTVAEYNGEVEIGPDKTI